MRVCAHHPYCARASAAPLLLGPPPPQPEPGAGTERGRGGDGAGTRRPGRCPRRGAASAPAVSLRSLMEPEKEKADRQPKKGRKRRRAPSKLVGAAEAMRAGWEFEERHPEVKVSSGGRPVARPGRPGGGGPLDASRSLLRGPESGQDGASLPISGQTRAASDWCAWRARRMFTQRAY